MMLQAYDFVELARRYGCNLQMGGSDQWGNIVNGIDLGRRMGTPQLYALTCPLLTTVVRRQDGQDRGRRRLAQRRRMLSPYDYWQFWRNTEDADVGRFLKLFTDAAAGRDRAAGGARRAPRSTRPRRCWRPRRPRCCTAATKAEAAAETARQTFEEGALAEGLPTVEVPAAELAAGIGVLAAFVQAGLVDVERRGAPADPGRRPARQRRGRRPTRRRSSTPAT